MKIAMIGHKAVPSSSGGIETVLTHLCPLLAERGAEVTCYNRKGDGVRAGYKKGGMYKGVRLKNAPTIRRRGLAAMVASFTAAIAASFSDYDIVHFHAEGPCAAMHIPKLFGKKCVATVHGLDWQRDKWHSGFAAKYIKHGEQVMAKYADAVIVLSEPAQAYFKNTYDRATVIIPNGISRPVIRPAEIIKKHGLEKGGYICSVSRLTEEKDIHYLIEAFLKLNTDKKLVICGDTSDINDEYTRRVLKMAEGKDNIIFTGFITGRELEEVFSNCYMYCLPSKLEGMSVSLLEALSYGCTVVCSDIPENTCVAGEHAAYFKSGNAEALKEVMQELIDRPELAEEYRSKSSDFICGAYSWEKTADMTYALYEELCGGGNSGNAKDVTAAGKAFAAQH